MQNALLRKLILFALIGLMISLKGDNRFPLPASLSEPLFQLLLIPYTFVFIAVIILYFHPPEFLRRLEERSLVRLASGICIVFVTGLILIFFWQARKYSQFGYHVDVRLLTGVYVAAEALLLQTAWKGSNAKRFIITSTLIFVAFYALSIYWFPLHPDRSDMLPLIEAAGKRFVAGYPAYTVYSFPHLVPLTYLPAMWMAYVPAVLFHFDLRWIHATAVMVSAWMLYAAACDRSRGLVACLCGIFLLTPYLLYRHDIYLGILWLCLSAIYFFEQKNRPLLAAAWIGIASAVSQFAWILVPFYLLGIYRRSGWKQAANAFVISTAVFCVFVAPFVIQSPLEFYRGVFGHWSHTFNATTLNLSYFPSLLFSANVLKYFQACIVLVTFLLACRTVPTGRYEWMTYALLFFILLNPLIWVYFYLTVLILMIAEAGTT